METEEELKRKVTEGVGMCAVLIIVFVLISVDLRVAAFYLIIMVCGWSYLNVKRGRSRDDSRIHNQEIEKNKSV